LFPDIFNFTSHKAGDHFATPTLNSQKILYFVTYPSAFQKKAAGSHTKCNTNTTRIFGVQTYETHKDRQEMFVPVIFTNTELPKYKFYTGETNRMLQEFFNAGVNT
jgi:hypothetical protein